MQENSRELEFMKKKRQLAPKTAPKFLRGEAIKFFTIMKTHRLGGAVVPNAVEDDGLF